MNRVHPTGKLSPYLSGSNYDFPRHTVVVNANNFLSTIVHEWYVSPIVPPSAMSAELHDSKECHLHLYRFVV